MAIERAYVSTQPQIEAMAEQRLKDMMAGNYTPVMQAWFQKAMNPMMGKLQSMGIIRSGGAGRTLAGVGGDVAAQQQQQALSQALGLGGQQRGYEQFGQQLGLQRYSTEGGWEQQAQERELQRQIAKQQQKQAFWNTLGTIGGGLLSGGLLGGLGGLLGGLGGGGGGGRGGSRGGSSGGGYLTTPQYQNFQQQYGTPYKY